MLTAYLNKLILFGARFQQSRFFTSIFPFLATLSNPIDEKLPFDGMSTPILLVVVLILPQKNSKIQKMTHGAYHITATSRKAGINN
jgi:hypothetical protein